MSFLMGTMFELSYQLLSCRKTGVRRCLACRWIVSRAQRPGRSLPLVRTIKRSGIVRWHVLACLLHRILILVCISPTRGSEWPRLEVGHPVPTFNLLYSEVGAILHAPNG